MWATCIVGVACGSQTVHVQYNPLEGIDEMIKQEVQRLREKIKIRKPSKSEKIQKLLELDRIYVETYLSSDKSE